MRPRILALFLAYLSCLLAGPGGSFGATYNFPPDAIPTSLVAGDVLNVSAYTGPLPFFFTPDAGSTINVLPGGGFDNGISVRGAINYFAGSSGIGSWTLDGGTLTALGGIFGPTSLINGAHATVDGGKLFGGIQLRSGSVLDFYSGVVSGEIFGEVGTVAYLHGGALSNTQGPAITMRGGELRLVVQEAMLGGAPIPGLTPGKTVAIPDRNIVLSGELADGSPMSMLLSGQDGNAHRYTFAGAESLKVTLVPEPTAGLLAVLGALYAAGRTRRSRSN